MAHRSVSTYKEKTCQLPPLSPIRIIRNCPPEHYGSSIPKSSGKKDKAIRFPSLFRVRRIEEPSPIGKQRFYHGGLPLIDPKDLRIGECVSELDGKKLYKALRVSTGQTMAVKYFCKSKLQLSDLSEYCRIFAQLNKLAMKGTVRYFGVLLQQDGMAICSEFISEGTLAHGLDPISNRRLIRHRLNQLSEIVAQFHQAQLPHNNLKLSNVLVNVNGQIKLTDWRPSRSINGCGFSRDCEAIEELVRELAEGLGIKKRPIQGQKQNLRFETFEELLDYFIPENEEGSLDISVDESTDPHTLESYVH